MSDHAWTPDVGTDEHAARQPFANREVLHRMTPDAASHAAGELLIRDRTVGCDGGSSAGDGSSRSIERPSSERNCSAG